MAVDRPPEPIYRFGSFEFDAAKCELRKNGGLRTLQKKPCQALQLLLERAPDVVSRDELAAWLWGDRRYADFEDRLNHVISRLRTVLTDASSDSIFIATSHGIGYRFVYPVTVARSPDRGTSVAPPRALRPLERITRIHRPGWLVAGALSIALLAVLFGGQTSRNEVDYRGLSNGKPSVAILQFINLTGQAEYDYLTAALREGVIADLTRVGTLQVSSLGEIASAPGTGDADYVMRSALLSSETTDSLRLTARLMSTDQSRTVWSSEFRRNEESLDQFQTRATAELIAELQGHLLPPEEQRLAMLQPTTPRVEMLHQQGRELLRKGLVDEAVEKLEQVIKLDPDRALAHSDLARALLHMGWYTAAESVNVMPAARVAALRARQLDASLAEPYLVLANVTAFFEWQWAEAEQLYEQAIARNPTYAATYLDYAAYLLVTGRVEEGIEYIERAEEVDPLSASTHGQAAVLYHYLSDWQRTQHHLELALAIEPGNIFWRVNQGCTYIFQGRLDMGASTISQLRTEVPNHPLPMVIDAYYHAVIRDDAEAAALLDAIHDDALPSMPQLLKAAVYAELDRPGEAMDLLEDAYEKRLVALPFTVLHPTHAPLRSDPRHADLLRRMGLQPSETGGGAI